jgi:hypothetical protein
MNALLSSPHPHPHRLAHGSRALALALAIAAAGVTSSPPAFAETRADELFQEGRKAMKTNDWPAALASLSQSYKLEPAPGTLLNVAECEMHVGKLALALEHFKQVEIALPAQDKRRSVAVERALSLAQRVPRLVVKLAPTAPAGTEVFRGDARVEIGATVLVDPGPVALRVTAPGRRERVLTVTTKESATTAVSAEPEGPDGPDAPALTPAVPPPPAQPPPSSDSAVAPSSARAPENGKRTAGFVVGGFGVASLGVGVVTGIMALGKASTVKDHCDPNLACDPQGVDAGSSGKTLSLVSTITVAAGLVGIGVGTFLVVTSKGKTVPTTAIAPVVSPGFAGAALWRSF